MKQPCTTVHETEYFKIYHDALGRYWVWNKAEEINHAYRVSDEITAYRKALDSAIYLQKLHKEGRRLAESNLSKFEALSQEIWPYTEESYE